METIHNIFSGDDSIGLILFTWIGANIGHILSLYDTTFKGTTAFVEGIIPGRTATFYKRIDFIFLPVIGAILASYLIDPKTIPNSIFAGISWSGTIMALLKRNVQPFDRPKGV